MAALQSPPSHSSFSGPAVPNRATASTSPKAASPTHQSKRQKVTRACDACKNRKRRCTGELPCSSCWTTGGHCTYDAAYTRGRVVAPTPSIHLAKNAGVTPLSSAKQTNGSTSLSCEPSAESTADANSHVHRRASRAGSPEHEPATLAGQYSGPSSGYSFLRRAWKRFGLDANKSEDGEPHQAGVPIFNFGDKFIPRDVEALSSFQLPPRTDSQSLVATYFDFSMPTYRYLHKPTVLQWLSTYQDQLDGKEGAYLLPSRQAVVLMVLATALLFTSERHGDEPWRDSEPYFNVAQAKLAAETGKARLESVQARTAICLYLLSTSRPNQSWYTWGVTCQLMMALGMHRHRPKTAPQQDPVTSECRRRAFWAAYTIDFYLSVILGRPHMIHDDHSDQRFPQSLDDEEIRTDGLAVNDALQKDRVVQASIYHAKITSIVKQSIRKQYALNYQSSEEQLAIASRLNQEVSEWKASLPVILSGAIHPSSLIQIYQRQIVVLRLAYVHAEMLINRPLMLIEPPIDTAPHVIRCLNGAKTTIDTVLQYVSDKRMFAIFWHSQYVTFNALSIIYVWLIQRKRGRMSGIQLPFSDDVLFQLAETTQDHFAEATAKNAPCTRFSIILEELQGEAHRLMARDKQHRPPHPRALLDTPAEGHPFARPAKLPHTLTAAENADSMSWESLGADFPLDPDLWLQLDSFPFSDIDFDNLGDAL